MIKKDSLVTYAKHDAEITLRMWRVQRHLEHTRRQRLLVEATALLVLIAVAAGTFWLMVFR